MISVTTTFLLAINLVALLVPSACSTIPADFTDLLKSKNQTVVNESPNLPAGPGEQWTCRRLGYQLTYYGYEFSRPMFQTSAMNFVTVDVQGAFDRVHEQFEQQWNVAGYGLRYSIRDSTRSTTSIAERDDGNGHASELEVNGTTNTQDKNHKLEDLNVWASILCTEDWIQKWPTTFKINNVPNTSFSVYDRDRRQTVAQGTFGRENSEAS